MSFPRFELQCAVRDARSYSRSEKAVLNAIVSRANDVGACWPEYTTLADDTGYSRAAVAAAIANLKQRNDGPVRLIVQHQGKRDGSGGRGSNLYRVELSPFIALKPVESIPETQPVVESNHQMQPAAASPELSPEIPGLSPEIPGVESSEWTGSSPKKPSKKPSKRELAAAAIDEVFERWKQDTGHLDATLDAKRAGKIKARLREGFTPEQLGTVFKQRRNDPWLMGETDRSTTVYDGIATLLRDREQVERLLRLAKPHKPSAQRGPQRLPEPQRGVVNEAEASNWGKGQDSKLAKAVGGF